MARAEDYDDETTLAAYAYEHYQHLMTEHEQRGYFAWAAELRDAIGRHWIAADIRETHKITGDPELDTALGADIKEFRQRVVRRLLEVYKEQLFINRCPSCGRIVRTPKAQQCLWCGEEWHSRTVEEAKTDAKDFRSSRTGHG